MTDGVKCVCGTDVSDNPFDSPCYKCGTSASVITLKTILDSMNIDITDISQYDKTCISCGRNFSSYDIPAEKLEHEQKMHPEFYCMTTQIIKYDPQTLFMFYYPAINNFINQNCH